ncbi:MAG TPA: lipopolysaccharide transport periplasmic protein LptA [Candidatus Nitrosotalea sp.]|jgi:lipopolysaccharide export system protein LptA|nr:lipopolysaccharide transport periplasmic protein LptA [Candidatus Nitrosotalea sp.]
MTRALVAGALVLWLAAIPATPAWAQTGTGRSRPARPPAAVPSPRPEGPAAGNQDGRNAPVTVDADQLENIQKEGLVVFSGNVVASQNSSTQWADRMEVYLDDKGDKIVRTVSTGNVRIITKDCRSGTAKRAEYYDAEQRVVLIGNARVWRDDNVVTGERITIYLAEDRSVVEGGQQERVKAVFYPRNQDEAAARPKAAPGQCS